MKPKELQVFVSTIAEMFGPEDVIGPEREDKLLKIIQYVKKYNLTFEMIRRWYSNVFKIDDAVRDVTGWTDVTVTVPEKAKEEDLEKAYLTAKSKAPPGPPPSGAAASS